MTLFRLSVFLILGLLSVYAQASFEGNLNYASPSRRHTQLGVDVKRVDRRAWKRGNTPFSPSDLNFTHGVASGDPWPHSVILWTRVAPSNKSEDSTAPLDVTEPLYSHETKKFIEADKNPVCLIWKVFKCSKGKKQDVVASGKAYTTADIDYTVKVRKSSVELVHILRTNILRFPRSKQKVFNL